MQGFSMQSMKTLIWLRVDAWTHMSDGTVNSPTTTAFIPKYVAIKMNMLLYRILNEQIDMLER